MRSSSSFGVGPLSTSMNFIFVLLMYLQMAKRWDSHPTIQSDKEGLGRFADSPCWLPLNFRFRAPIGSPKDFVVLSWVQHSQVTV